MNADIAMQGIVLSLASGRVAYCLTSDEIMRPMREWIWMRSAPEDATIRSYVPGSIEYLDLPAALYHRVDSIEGTSYHYRPMLDPRPAQFIGQIFECVFCMAFWTSLLACAAWLLIGEAAVATAAPLAVWALSNTYAAKGI